MENNNSKQIWNEISETIMTKIRVFFAELYHETINIKHAMSDTIQCTE